MCIAAGPLLRRCAPAFRTAGPTESASIPAAATDSAARSATNQKDEYVPKESKAKEEKAE